jgi:predicted aldo/keto reductase-like oxidoreductase
MFDFFDEAVKDGRIRYPSFSFHDEFKLFKTILESYDWQMTQIQYNYLDIDYQAGRAGLKLAYEKNMAIVIMEPLRGGFLVKYIPEEQEKALKVLRPNWSLASWGLNWLWNQREISVVLSGMSDMEQTEDNLKSAENFTKESFNNKDEEAIVNVQKYFAGRMKVNCTACGYSMPCPSGVHIPKNFNFLNQYHFFDAKEAIDRCIFFYGIQVAPKERAVNCISCGECVEKCPQHIAIPGFRFDKKHL